MDFKYKGQTQDKFADDYNPRHECRKKKTKDAKTIDINLKLVYGY